MLAIKHTYRLRGLDLFTQTMKAIKLLVICVVATCITTSCYPTKMRANYGNQCATFRR